MAGGKLFALQRGHAVLGNQDAAVFQATLAVGVELFAEQGGAGPDRVGRVDNRDVEAPVRVRNEPGAVGDDQFGARILEGAVRQRRQVGLRQFHHARIDLDLCRADLRVAQDLAQAAAIAAPTIRMSRPAPAATPSDALRARTAGWASIS